MKIALLASLYAPHVIGGAELVVQNQAEALAARGHTVHVLTLGEPDSGTVRTSVNGVDVIRVGIRNLYLPSLASRPTGSRVLWHVRDVFNAQMARHAGDLLRSLKPDIVVVHNMFGWSTAIWPAIHALGLPGVQVLHDQYLRCVRSNMFKERACASPCGSCRLLRIPHRRLSHLPDAVVGVSRYVVESLAEDGYFRNVPLLTRIRNASHLDTRTRPTPPLTGPEIVFGFIGSLSPVKGIETLLRAFQSVAKPNWRLRVAGDGEAAFMERLQDRHAHPGIQFLGRQDPATFFLGLDATVVPSLCHDTLPSVVFESLIHGRPVIGPRRGGIPEMVQHGASGLLYDEPDLPALTSAVTAFAENVAAWRGQQAAIKAAAAPLYCDREAWIGRWESVFSSVLSGSHRR